MSPGQASPATRAGAAPEKAARTRELVHLIVNERAGRGQGALAGSEAEAALVSRGVRVVRATTSGPGDAERLARAARRSGASVVAAVGGDGTLHEVVNGLLGDELLRAESVPSPRPLLGQIPVGSGNDYSKMLHVSRTDPRAAAASLLDGPARWVDVGVLEGAAPRDDRMPRPEIFLNNLGLAFAGDANARIESTRGLPGYLAYFFGAAMAFFTWKACVLEIEVDRKKLAAQPVIVHVNLGRYCGGGVIFTPDAELDDGLFDVLVMGEHARWQSVLVWKSMTEGGGRHLPDVAILKGKEVVVRGPAGKLLHADGEVRKFVGKEVRARVVPRAIEVIFGR